MEPTGAAAGPQKPRPIQPTATFHAAAATLTGPSTSLSFVAATAASLVAVGLGGGALLVWWALAFHPAHARLWMVPAWLSAPPARAAVGAVSAQRRGYRPAELR